MSYNFAHASTVQIVVPGTYAAPKTEEPIEDFGLVFNTGSDGCVIEGTAADLLALAATIVKRLSFDATQDDWWVCVCGNDPHGAGLYPCDADGSPVEPLEGSGWSGHYFCASCGRYGRQGDRTPEARVPVLGYSEHVARKDDTEPRTCRHCGTGISNDRGTWTDAMADEMCRDDASHYHSPEPTSELAED
jgi:hypothetical protein